MLRPVAKALWGHYRRHPLQIFLVWLGLTLGIALLVGVMAVNQQAKESYRKGEYLFSNPFPYRVRSVQMGMTVTQGFYINMRRAGIRNCAPVDEYRVFTNDRRNYQLLGIDPVAMMSALNSNQIDDGKVGLLQLMRPPYPIIMGTQLANYTGLSDGSMITLASGRKIGPVKVIHDNRMNGSRMFADIALVRDLKPSSGFSALVCSDMSQKQLAKLKSILPTGLTLEYKRSARLESLTEAFHLNLFAMGMLSFVVGLFIFYQAISLSLTQRQPLVGVLRQLGVSHRELTAAIVIELFVWVVLGLIGGNLLGLLLAQQLLPSVAASLNDIYSANVNLNVQWHWMWGLSSFAIAVLGCAFACAWPLVRLIKSPPARLATHISLVRFSGREFLLQAIVSIVFIVIALILYHMPQSQVTGFLLIAFLLIGMALVLPYILWRIFHLLGRISGSARLRWFFTDAAASLSYRGVAAMAFMLAFSSNIGMETMVGSFRNTTEHWLEKNLVADVYLSPSTAMAPRMYKWLQKQPSVEQVWLRGQKELPSETGMIQVTSIGDSQQEKQILSAKIAMPDYWQKLHHNRAVMISESMALKHHLTIGDRVDLPAPMDKGWQVVGIYYDYGNPYDQIMITQDRWKQFWPRSGKLSLAVHFIKEADGDKLLADIGKRFHLQPERIQNNTVLMQQAMSIFDRTFVVTSTLGNLTLFIAVCGLFFATIAGEISRQRQFALLRCIGMSGIELILWGGGQLLAIGLFSALVALPLGLVLAHLLIDVVLKYSFGWTMQVQYFPADYFTTLGASLLALLVAGICTTWRLLRRSAIVSLRESF